MTVFGYGLIGNQPEWFNLKSSWYVPTNNVLKEGWIRDGVCGNVGVIPPSAL